MEIRQLGREIRIGLRPDGGRRKEILAQYERHRQSCRRWMPRGINSRRWYRRLSPCHRRALLWKQSWDEDDAADDDVLPQADTVPEEDDQRNAGVLS